MEDGDGGVDTTSLAEESSNSSARALGGNEDDIDIGGNIDLGLILEDRGETVREVESLKISIYIESWNFFFTYLALGDLGFDCWPGLTLSGVREQVHDDGALGDSLINFEEVLSWDPAILLGVLPRLAVLADTDNYIQSIIAHVQGLSVTLRSVSDDSHCVILEVVLGHCEYVCRRQQL